MYQSHFQLHDRPFASVANPDHYFPASSIEQAREVIALNLERASGTTTLVGGVGSGKTLLCQLIANQFANSLPVSMVSGSRLRSAEDLLQAILHGLDLPHHGQDESELRRTLANHVTGQSCLNGIVLIIDEADRLSIELLEEVRGFTNLVKDGQPCIRLVLAGTESLEESLGTSALESLNQRVVGRLFLENFSQEETRDYIRARIQAVGGDAEAIFADDAFRNVYKATNGVPRLVNQICDHALLMASVSSVDQLDGNVVEAAWADIQQIPVPSSALQESSAGDSAEVVIEFGSLDDEDEDLSAEAGEQSIVVDFGDSDSVVEESSEQIEIQFDGEIEVEGGTEVEISFDDDVAEVVEITVEDDSAEIEMGIDEQPLDEQPLDESPQVISEVAAVEVSIDSQASELANEVVIEDDLEVGVIPTSIDQPVEAEEAVAVEISLDVSDETTEELAENVQPEVDIVVEPDVVVEADLAPTIEDDIDEEEDEVEMPETDQSSTEEVASEPSEYDEELTIDQITNPFGAQFGGASEDQPREAASYLEGADFPESTTLQTSNSESAAEAGVVSTNDVVEVGGENPETADDQELVVNEFASAESLARDGAPEVSTSYSQSLSDQLAEAQPALKMHVEDTESTDALVNEDPESSTAQDEQSEISAVDEAEIRDTDQLSSDLDEISQDISDLQDEYDGPVNAGQMESDFGSENTSVEADQPRTSEQTEFGQTNPVAEDLNSDGEQNASEIAAEESVADIDANSVESEPNEFEANEPVADELELANEEFDPSEDPVLPEEGVESLLNNMTSSMRASITTPQDDEALTAEDGPDNVSDASIGSTQLEDADDAATSDLVTGAVAATAAVATAASATVASAAVADPVLPEPTLVSSVADEQVVADSTNDFRQVSEAPAKEKKVFSTLFSKMRRN